jgi:hypothetical protein
MSGENNSSPEVPPGETLLYTLPQLTRKIEGQHQNRRLEMARAYLGSLTMGIKGLEGMGHRIGFRLLPEPEPIEYPKMLYKKTQWVLVENREQEQVANSSGFLPKALPEAKPTPEPPSMPSPPTVTIRLPDAFYPASGPVDGEI